jgi:aminopeptidase N
MRTRLRVLAAIAFGPLAAIAGSVPACTPAPATPNEVTIAPPATASSAIDSNAPPPPAPREDGRLPETATPLGYELTLWIDPRLPTFHGTAEIAVDVPAPTRHVVLHARDMTITHAEAVAGSSRIAATAASRTSYGGVVPEELVLTFERELPAGKAAIRVDYGAPFAADLSGLYRVQEKGLWYAYTQFEATDARRAFPCFDEPRYKTPFRVHIHAPAGTIALANAPAQPAGPSDAPGQATTFETTPPLPTYLVAFAVGPFDILSGPPHEPPIRVVTTRGRSGLAGLALDTAQAMIEQLSDYFDMAYPYAKLDIVAVPDFGAGAMENPGLVTFRDTLLLVDRDHATTSIKRSQASVIAHEFAHQWFGDLVTMQWWDDLWLNEGFATWAAAKMVDRWRPSFGATLEQIAGTQGVMDVDALDSARAVREPVRSTAEAKEAFDGITYDKGAAVLRMIESWLGADTFRRGVQQYLKENAWKNARAEDLFKAIDFVSAQHVGPLAAAFLDQPGVPEVLTSWTCIGPSAGKLELRQSEWRPLGEDRHDGPRSWTLPVCVATNTQKAKSCFTVTGEPIARALGGTCPSWVYPNADGAGYYRFVVDRPRLIALAGAERSLGVAERVGLVSNAWAGVRQGAISPGTLLDVLPMFDADPNRLVVDQVVGTLAGVDAALIEDGARPAFRRYVTARLAPKKRALGWEDKTPSTDDDAALTRRSVLWALGEVAGDAATLDEAERWAARWLRDPSSVPADVAVVAVPLASKRAGAAWLAELRTAAREAKTPQDRTIALRAMGMFDDAITLRSALDLLLGDEIKLSELRYVFGEAAHRRETYAVVYAWEKEHWAQLRARMPGSFGAGMLVDVAGSLCSPAARDDASAFFVSAIAGMEGAKRPLDESLERAGLCVALRRGGAEAVTKYFAGR